MIKLNLGCGLYIAKGYINVDSMFSEEDLKNNRDKEGNPFENCIWEKGARYVQGDILDLPFPDNYADVIESHQVMEHIRMTDVLRAMSEIHRVLKPGGKFRFSVPSFNGLVTDWLAWVTRANFTQEEFYHRAQEFYGIQVNEGEFHRCPFTPDWAAYCLTEAKFKSIDKMILFAKFGRMPKDKKLGLIATSPKPFGDATGFRHEIIFCEATK